MKQFLTLTLLISALCNGQVGIGTIEPQADLHIAGELLVQEEFKTALLNSVSSTEEDFQLVTRATTSNPVGKVTRLDINQLSVAPINIINYNFTNLDGDNLTDVDLQYDSSKYIVAIANFQYIGDAVRKTTINGSARSMGTFVVRTFESGGSWHLEIGNRELDPSSGDTVSYKVTLVLYTKAYYRELPSITTNLGGTNNGVASSIPNLY